MSLTLYFHPLSSFCQKALVALYENDTPFEPQLVDLGNKESRAAFLSQDKPARSVLRQPTRLPLPKTTRRTQTSRASPRTNRGVTCRLPAESCPAGRATVR